MSKEKKRFLTRITSHHKVDELAVILKEFLKEVHKVHHEYTFEEMKEIIGRKRISVEVKEKIHQLCDILSDLEYRKRKASKKEISTLKKVLKEIVKASFPEEKAEEKPPLILSAFQKRSEKIKKNKEKHKKIKEKVEKVKKKIEKDIEKKVKQVYSDEDKKELLEIKEFIRTSLELGISKRDLKKELKEMGFKKELIAKSI